MSGPWDGFVGNIVGALISFAAAVTVLLASRRHAETMARRERSRSVATEIFTELQMLWLITGEYDYTGIPTTDIPLKCNSVSFTIDARFMQFDSSYAGLALQLGALELRQKHSPTLAAAIAKRDGASLERAILSLRTDVRSMLDALRAYLTTPEVRAHYWAFDRNALGRSNHGLPGSIQRAEVENLGGSAALWDYCQRAAEGPETRWERLRTRVLVRRRRRRHS